MAFSKSNIVASPGAFNCVQTDATSTVDILKGAAGEILKVEIDNTGNSVAVYLKAWDTTGSVTVGTTANDFAFKCPASSLRVYSCPNGAAFANGLKVACVTEGGGTAGNTSPTVDVIYRILVG